MTENKTYTIRSKYDNNKIFLNVIRFGLWTEFNWLLMWTQ